MRVNRRAPFGRPSVSKSWNRIFDISTPGQTTIMHTMAMAPAASGAPHATASVHQTNGLSHEKRSVKNIARKVDKNAIAQMVTNTDPNRFAWGLDANSDSRFQDTLVPRILSPNLLFAISKLSQPRI
jgi:hypothetical protein